VGCVGPKDGLDAVAKRKNTTANSLLNVVTFLGMEPFSLAVIL